MKKRPRKRIVSADARYVGDEPFYSKTPTRVEMTLAYNWYNYQFSSEDAVKFLNEYLKDNKRPLIRKLRDWEVPTTVGWIARLLTIGSTVNSDSIKWFESKLSDLYTAMEKRVEVEQQQVDLGVKAPRIAVAERVKRQVGVLIGEELDYVLDQFYNGEIDSFDLYAWMKENDVKAKQAAMVVAYLQRLLDELQSDDPAVYETRTKRSAVREIKFYQALIKDGLTWVRGAKVVKKPRKPRTVKEKNLRTKVGKVVYQPRDDELKITSEDPAKILGAEVVFVYNTKRKQLTSYVAADPNKGLEISRSSIRGYDEQASQTKRLGRPKGTLDQMVSSPKTKAVKTFNTIKSKGMEPSGRLNANTVILKVYK